jgi:hypothetical protein
MSPSTPPNTLKFRLAALPKWKQQQMLAHYQFRDPEFSGGGALSDNTGEAQ